MAAPRKLTAQEMKQAQAAKQAAYDAEIRKAAQPHADRFIKRLEGSLQTAFEARRPSTSIKESFSPPGVVELPGLDVGDMVAFINAVKALVSTNFGPPRNYTVSFEDGPGMGWPNYFNAVLTW